MNLKEWTISYIDSLRESQITETLKIIRQSKDYSTNKPNLVEKLNTLLEKNVPTNPSKWSYYKSQAKKKFDVYPSAYANAWAAKKYKAAGGGWKKESVNEAKFRYDPKIDYFDEYELLPQEVQDVLDAHDFDDDSYAAAKKTIKQLNKVGWTADYELSGDMTDLKPLGESVNEVSWAEMEKIAAIQKQIKKHIQDNYKDSIDYNKKDRWMKGYSDLVGHFGKELNKKNLKNIAKLAKQKNDKKLMKLLSDLSNI
tara:strand:- start:34221 stop:34982 length:762 start_codon:yes stop_codon:yes gene_type:complete